MWHRRVGVRCLWGGGAALELASRARGAALAVVGSGLVAKRRTGERALFSDATPWCNVPAAASNFKPALRVSCGTGVPALAVSGEEARHSSLLRVRVVPRWLWSTLTLPKDAATARYGEILLPFGARPRCGVPAAALRWTWSALTLLKSAAPARCFRLRRTTVVQRASCGLQLQASAVCLTRFRRVGARCLWEGGASL